ncbi:hypothetical protein P691DRAFT_803873 [Macrolepiota fuliginosa MF-IS2]|uniref:Uncharacterized protein n=1 Tax=Macrolepiota fuliginosa MF-IS2 TaxID=1400762 RepID=A0A9P6C2M8_9AGAR|nr:hypothetical protein P691DRAFT_803873 [Macrolepiota fuliginosa MF-IS2]
MTDAVPTHKEIPILLTASLTFGVSLCTLGHCVRWLIYSDEGWSFRKRIHWVSVVISFLIFSLNVVSLGLTCWRLEDAVFHLESRWGNADHYSPSWVAIVNCTATNSTALLADYILIYRCWHVYNKTLAIIVFPIVLWIGGTVCAALQTYLLVAQANGSNITPFSWGPVTAFGPGIVLLPFLASTAVLNAYSTFVLIHRIHKVTKQTQGFNSTRNFRYIIRILAESGFLYLSVTLGHFIAWLTTNAMAIEVLSTLNVPVISIAFHLVIIRSAQNRIEVDRKALCISTLRFNPVTVTSRANSILRADNEKGA